jgi:hypothetical protein
VIIDVIVGAASDLYEQHGERKSGIVLLGGSVRLVEAGHKAVQCVEHIAPVLNGFEPYEIGAGRR